MKLAFENRFIQSRGMPTDILTILKTWGRLSASELQLRLGVSRATMMRAVKAQSDRVIVRGNARRAAYAARRKVRGSDAAIRLFRIDEQGQGAQIGLLDPVYPHGAALLLQPGLPRLPLPDESAAWTEAACAAVVFWESAGADRRISAAFRALCKANAKLLRAMA